MNSNLPNSWKLKSLRDLATINYGKSASTILSDDGEIPVVGTGGVERYGSDYLYEGDSIILGRKGTIDKVSYVIGKFWAIDTAYFLSAFQDEASVRWLYYFLQSVGLRSLNEATGVPSLSRELLYKIGIPTPHPQEQLKIAEILSTLDRAIVQTEALIAKQQRIKTGLMQDLLTKGIDEHGNIRSEATHEFKDSPLGRIPLEWDVSPLRKHLSFLSYGFTNPMPEAGEGPYMVTAANVYGGKIDYDGCRRTERQAFDTLLTAKSRPRIGDVLITKDGTLGRIAVVDRDDVCINQSVAVLRFREGISNRFAATLLSSPIYQDRILADAGGSTIKHIYISKLDKMHLATPPDTFEQTQIRDVLLNQDQVVTDAEQELRKLRRVKNGLMHDLLTGECRVTPLLAKVAAQ